MKNYIRLKFAFTNYIFWLFEEYKNALFSEISIPEKSFLSIGDDMRNLMKVG